MRRFILPVLLAAACSAPQKPRSLQNLEEMRRDRRYLKAQDFNMELTKQCDEAYDLSADAFDQGEIKDSIHWAIVGISKLRTAYAMMDRGQIQSQVDNLGDQIKKLEMEQGKLNRDMRMLDDKLELHSQVAQAEAEAAERKAALDEAQRKMDLQRKISDAELALKMADTVNSRVHEPSTYALAESLLLQARQAENRGDIIQGRAAADLAKQRAEEAYALARPRFISEQASSGRKAKNQELERRASSLMGVSVQLETRGSTRRLVIPVLSAFKKQSSELVLEKEQVIDEIGRLLADFPSYPVLIDGFTSHRVPSNQRYVLSHARAQRVAGRLARQGLPLDRFVVTGRGGEAPIGQKYSSVNDRVEITILYE